MGYHCDLPDLRDLNKNDLSETIEETHPTAFKNSYLFARHGLLKKDAKPFDLRDLPDAPKPWPVENQGMLQSCTAHAVVGMIEYLIRRGRTTKDVEDLSRLFLYKVTRQFLGWSGDSGATIRSTIRCASIFGMPPEEYWPYDITAYDVEPSPFLFSFAHSYQALKYARLDGYNDNGEKTLDNVKRALLDGFPVAFGFPVYSSVTKNPDIPLPRQTDKLIGGHAVLAVGFNDDRTNVGIDPKTGKETEAKGALLIRNSWGPTWGEQGYGYLPYAFAQNQWAVDFWTIFHQAWLDNEQFGAPIGSDWKSALPDSSKMPARPPKR
jgi:C1A family cysteine protease